jgi:hypothetical protein
MLTTRDHRLDKLLIYCSCSHGAPYRRHQRYFPMILHACAVNRSHRIGNLGYVLMLVLIGSHRHPVIVLDGPNIPAMSVDELLLSSIAWQAQCAILDSHFDNGLEDYSNFASFSHVLQRWACHEWNGLSRGVDPVVQPLWPSRSGDAYVSIPGTVKL